MKKNSESREAGGPSALMKPESDWVKGNRERYEAEGRSFLKEYAAQQMANCYNFNQTGDPELDLIIAAGLGDMADDPEFSHMFCSTGSLRDTGGADIAPEGKKSKRQKKLERQRESARRFNAQRPPG